MTTLKFLELTDFRNYPQLELQLHPGLTLVSGRNGVGKTNLIEAMGFLARGTPLRQVPAESLIRTGQQLATVRGEFQVVQRDLLVEAQLPQPPKRLKIQVNRQALARKSDLPGMLKLTTFLPSHMSLVQGGPDGRRAFLDDCAMALFPPAAPALADLQGVLRQRNALLRQTGGQLSAATAATLDVWDAQLTEAAQACLEFRLSALRQVAPYVAQAYQSIAGVAAETQLTYQPSWDGSDFAAALGQARRHDLRRGYTTIGPHRDDAQLALNSLVAKTHASQGEQRTLALALRLALHQIQRDTHQETPLLLLDDVLSELDEQRSLRLLAALPSGQVFITSAVPLPPGVRPDEVLDAAQLV